MSDEPRKSLRSGIVTILKCDRCGKIFAGVSRDGDRHKISEVGPGHDYRPLVTGVIRSGLRKGQAPCNSVEGQDIQGRCGGSIPPRHNLAGSEPARQHQIMGRGSRKKELAPLTSLGDPAHQFKRTGTYRGLQSRWSAPESVEANMTPGPVTQLANLEGA